LQADSTGGTPASLGAYRESLLLGRRWSNIHSSLGEAGPKKAEAGLLEDASFYLDGWLQDRNRTAIKARGF